LFCFLYIVFIRKFRGVIRRVETSVIVIIGTLEQNHDLKQNQNVIVKIDWAKRYRLMKLHFAAEIVLELVYQDYNHPKKIGANITREKARVDFFWEGNISEIFPNLMSKTNNLIGSSLDIISVFEDEENERRYWQIDGFASELRQIGYLETSA